jgi:hypothetical protein
MDIHKTRESIENVLELLTESLLSILDLSGVETWWKISNQRLCFIDNRDNFFFPAFCRLMSSQIKMMGIVPLIRLILKPARI